MPDVLTFSTKARDPPTNAAKHPARGRKITIAPNTDGGVDAFQSSSGRCSCCTPSSSRGRANVAQLVTAPYVAARCSRLAARWSESSRFSTIALARRLYARIAERSDRRAHLNFQANRTRGILNLFGSAYGE